MLLEETKRRQGMLMAHLRYMSTVCLDEDQVSAMLEKLGSIYTGHFRHNYSEFFPFILEIAKDNARYSLDYLSNNLETLRQIVEKNYLDKTGKFLNLYYPLSKLSDHINLEIARYSYSSRNEQKVADLEAKNQSLQLSLDEMSKKLETANNKVAGIQAEMIAVLSIFSAIIMTFAGGISFTAHAFDNMAKAPFFKSVFLVLLCGFSLLNIIFVMMYVVAKITNRNIYARCKTEYCTCGEEGTPACSPIVRAVKRLPYVFLINAIFILLMGIILWLWYKYGLNIPINNYM